MLVTMTVPSPLELSAILRDSQSYSEMPTVNHCSAPFPYFSFPDFPFLLLVQPEKSVWYTILYTRSNFHTFRQEFEPANRNAAFS